MAKDSVVTNVQVDLNNGSVLQPTTSQTPIPAQPDDPFCILVLGDFSGRASRHVCEPETLSDRRIHTIDRDDFDEVFIRLNPQLHLTLGGLDKHSVALTFRELDDLHPDQLYESVELFAELRTLRRRLKNPDTFAAAARQMGAMAQPGSPTDSSPIPTDQSTATPDGSSLLDAALEATDHAPQKPLIDQLIDEIVAPYVIPGPDPRLPDLLTSVDSGIAHLMRQLLHHPEFQALEANWRGLYSLVRNLETNRTLKIQLLDVSLDELQADQSEHASIEQSAFYQRIVQGLVHSPDQLRPAVMVGCWQFGPTVDDVALLSQLASVGATAEAPLLASAASTFVGGPSFDQFPDPDDWTAPPEEFLGAWNKLRSQSLAQFLGLTMPDVLLRRPYSDDVEAFDFLELTDAAVHSDYLWGNAALLYGRRLGEAFTADGWQLNLQGQQKIGGLPMHFYQEDGDSVAKSCAEGWLTSVAAKAIAEFGLMPLISVKAHDSVLLGGLRSASKQFTLLRGRWGI